MPGYASSAPGQELGIDLHRRQRRACRALQFQKSACVVEMRVRIDQQLHLLGPKAELSDVGENLRRRLDEAAVEQDVPLRRRDEKRSDLVRADVMDVADEPEGLDGLVPAPVAGVGLREQSSEQTKEHAPIIKTVAACARARSRSYIRAMEAILKKLLYGWHGPILVDQGFLSHLGWAFAVPLLGYWLFGRRGLYLVSLLWMLEALWRELIEEALDATTISDLVSRIAPALLLVALEMSRRRRLSPAPQI